MCGFAGSVGPTPDRDGLEAALGALRHRGPDDQTLWMDADVGLAHARLAIIDRAHGSQPMFSADGRFAVVFNGEIYNHGELREELRRAGAPIHTACDTEVLPYLYAHDGPRMLERLRGMFAFAVIDLERGEVFLARDRFGKKPLYAAASSVGIRFASTLDALMPLLPARPELDPQAIAEYMVLQYVPGSSSPWRGVEKVPPGTWVRWSPEGVQRGRYWSPPLATPDVVLEREDAARELRERIREAVLARLESEVPLGVFLSGGLDSSVVVAEMAAAGVRAETYSVGFEAGPWDESHFAELVACEFNTDHHTLRLETDVSVLLNDLAWAYDEPFADSSALATSAVARAASPHVTVVLTGDGGDELFGGYDRYRAVHVGKRLRSRLGPAAAPLASAARFAGRAAGLERLELAARFAASPWPTCRDHLIHFTPQEAETMLRPELRGWVDPEAPLRDLDARWQEVEPRDGWVAWVDAQTYLPDDLLTKMDRATMAWGLEARSPLLDQDLWEWAAGLPRGWFLDARSGKNLVRDAYRGVLPEPILSRAKKGFSVPLASWLRGELREQVMDLLVFEGGALPDLIDSAAAASVVERFMTGEHASPYKVWNLVALASWFGLRRAPLPRKLTPVLTRA